MRSLLAITLTSAALTLTANARAQNCPANTTWPADDWNDRSAEVRAARAAQVAALDAYAFTRTGADEERLGIRTDGVVIVQRGEVIYERYAAGFTRAMPHFTWSVTKTITNALTGVAVGRGALRLDQSICEFVTAANPANCVVTVQNLLEFASGFAWREVYENVSNQVSSVLAMLYGEGRRDMVAFVTGHDRAVAPGTRYQYSTGDSALLASVVRRAMLRGGGTEDWPWETLFDPIGMRSAVMESDARGNPVGGSYFYATPRDLARFGYLYLNDGCWSGRRILPEGWVSSSTQVSEAFRRARIENDPEDVQGRQVWLNRPVPELGITRPWPDVPEDAYAARGHWGQSITVIPSRALVIVRTADDRQSGAFNFNRFLSLAMAVAQ